MTISGKPFWTWNSVSSGPRVWPQFWERLLQQTRIWEGLLSSRVWEGFLPPWLWPQLQLWPGCPVRLIRPGARLEVLLFGLQGSFAPLHKPLGVLLHVQGGEVQLKHKFYQRRSSSQVAPFFVLAFAHPYCLSSRESHHDSTYRSTRVGDSGIPHTSYGHSSSSYDSDRPYKNTVSNFSYNI